MDLKSVIQTTIRNIVTILVLDLIALPAGIALYLVHGFHIVHVILGVGYLYGVLLVYDTATLLYKNIRIVSAHDDQVHPDELIDDSYTDEPIKPEMQKAMDEVFDLQKH